MKAMRKPSKRQLEHWEEVLHDHKLGMGQGIGGKTKDGRAVVNYAGTLTDLGVIEEQEFGRVAGRVKPKGDAQ